MTGDRGDAGADSSSGQSQELPLSNCFGRARGIAASRSGPNRLAMALYSDIPAVFGICTNSTSARGRRRRSRVGTLLDCDAPGIVGQTWLDSKPQASWPAHPPAARCLAYFPSVQNPAHQRLDVGVGRGVRRHRHRCTHTPDPPALTVCRAWSPAVLSPRYFAATWAVSRADDRLVDRVARGAAVLLHHRLTGLQIERRAGLCCATRGSRARRSRARRQHAAAPAAAGAAAGLPDTGAAGRWQQQVQRQRSSSRRLMQIRTGTIGHRRRARSRLRRRKGPGLPPRGGITLPASPKPIERVLHQSFVAALIGPATPPRRRPWGLRRCRARGRSCRPH